MKPIRMLVLPLAFGCSTATDSAPVDTVDTGTKDPDGFEALAGAVFVQEGGAPGLASYVFAAEDNVYVDYSAAPEEWTLDNGTPLPPTKSFADPGYEGIRTFYGVIDWSTPEESTIGGEERWVYTMVFDEQYTMIEDGTLEAYDPDGELLYILTFGQDLVYTRYE